MPKLQYCTYVLISLKDLKLYSGSSSNLKERLTDHYHGRVKSTKLRRPFKLVYCEFFVAKQDSLRRERYFKTSAGKKSLRLIARDSLNVFLKSKLP